MRAEDVVIPSPNLSVAWADALTRVHCAPHGVLHTPLVISIEEFDLNGDPIEIGPIRDALDNAIEEVNAREGKRRIQTVAATASTIFPRMCWSPSSPRPAAELFAHYRERIYPRLRRLHALNRRGTYFLRMIEATGLKRIKNKLVPHTVNQLDEVLRWCRRASAKDYRMRQSALQVSIYDPAKDHNGAMRAFFPCLQQVSFGYLNDGLTVSAYYPAEYIFDRGYGNYLGLCHLGGFMAHELGMPLRRATVVVTLPELGFPGKGELDGIVSGLRGYTTNSEEARSEQCGVS